MHAYFGLLSTLATGQGCQRPAIDRLEWAECTATARHTHPHQSELLRTSILTKGCARADAAGGGRDVGGGKGGDWAVCSMGVIGHEWVRGCAKEGIE